MALLNFRVLRKKLADQCFLAKFGKICGNFDAAVNPVDFKIRLNSGEHKTPKILCYDTAGVVVAIVPDVSLFKVGDEVFYAGGMAPTLNSKRWMSTSITAYEAVFDRLGVPKKDPAVDKPAVKSVLILNGTNRLTVFPSASRAESSACVTQLGADHVVNRTEDIPKQLAAIGMFAWERMGTCPVFASDDIVERHRLLNHVSELVDAKRIHTTLGENLGTINSTNLRKAHAALEARRVVGKLVLSGF
ncbi:hypothetical protein AC1031_001737 [Aphanomyces cochlioides]|nr:hypothetical protein AC1031_001737 [Aphanomyces cochlioides]